MIDIESTEAESCLELDDLLRGLNCLASLDILDGKKRGLHILNKIRQSSVCNSALETKLPGSY